MSMSTHEQIQALSRQHEALQARDAELFAAGDWEALDQVRLHLDGCREQLAALREKRPVIKPENWRVLADTVYSVIGVPGNQDWAWRASRAFRAGKPGDYLEPVVAQVKRCIARTYNGNERAAAQSLLETFRNYGLID